MPIDETLRALTDLVRAGSVRYIGGSSFAAWQHLEALWAAKEYGLDRFVAEQTPYSLLDRRVERELLPMAASYGSGVTVWSPLAGGMLTGKYRVRRRGARGGRLEGDDSDWVRRHFVPAAFAVVDELAALAEAGAARRRSSHWRGHSRATRSAASCSGRGRPSSSRTSSARSTSDSRRRSWRGSTRSRRPGARSCRTTSTTTSRTGARTGTAGSPAFGLPYRRPQSCLRRWMAC